MELSDAPAPDSRVCHTSSWPLPVLPEHTQFRSNVQAMMTCPCHTFQLNPIISKALFLSALPMENVYFETRLSQNGWMCLMAFHTRTMLKWKCRAVISPHNWDCPSPPAPNLGSASGRVLRLLVGPWRLLIELWASANSTCLCFLGCAATVVGNYRCVGEHGYWGTVPPLSFLFAQALRWGV